MSQSSSVLTTYRQILKLCRRLPLDRRASAFEEARTTFRTNKNVSDPKEIEELLKTAESKMSFMKMITPRPAGIHVEENAGYYIYRGGEILNANAPREKKAGFSNWYAGNIDPADLARHKRLLDRQHFKGGPWANKK
eukprot:GILI01030738.1.p1 GENE.GILI01030738.1~~GILI01030738.1.p1  ORF type:complete len:154 (-),score=19.03 GILI01030738.1:51-461(-)